MASSPSWPEMCSTFFSECVSRLVGEWESERVSHWVSGWVTKKVSRVQSCFDALTIFCLIAPGTKFITLNGLVFEQGHVQVFVCMYWNETCASFENLIRMKFCKVQGMATNCTCTMQHERNTGGILHFSIWKTYLNLNKMYKSKE